MSFDASCSPKDNILANALGQATPLVLNDLKDKLNDRYTSFMYAAEKVTNATPAFVASREAYNAASSVYQESTDCDNMSYGRTREEVEFKDPYDAP